MAKVLVLGAGMVAKPIIHYLMSKAHKVTIADLVISKAEKIVNNHPNGKSVFLDVNDSKLLESLIKGNDMVVSLLPYEYHVRIAEYCIKYKINMITTSYVSEEMQKLDKIAKDAGIIILNELGLDPGIDHMTAKKVIDSIHNEGGSVLEFYSFCGALPAKIKTPFGYRFSWSPKGVVRASKNSARYLFDNEICEVRSEDIFKDVRKIHYSGLGDFEVYPNRDSISYIERFCLNESQTVLRGTLRHVGWCEILNAMRTLKMLSFDDIDLKNMKYKDFMAMLIKSDDSSNIRQKVCDYLKIKCDSNIIAAFDWLELFSDQDIKRDFDSPFNFVSDIMKKKLVLAPDEKDMVVLLHQFRVRDKDGKESFVRCELIDYGTPDTDTAIARTVALPAAIGVEMILNNTINVKGVHIPIIEEIYNPVINGLEPLGIKMKEFYNLKDSFIVE